MSLALRAFLFELDRKPTAGAVGKGGILRTSPKGRHRTSYADLDYVARFASFFYELDRKPTAGAVGY